MATPLDMPPARRTPPDQPCVGNPDKIKFHSRDDADNCEQWLRANVPAHQPGESYYCYACGWFHRRSLYKRRYR